MWLVAALRWPLTDGVVPWDSKNQFFAFFRFLAESLHAGTSVYWNPYHYGGHPSIADPQSLILSPPFLAWAWLDRTPSLRSFDLIVYAHLLIGGLAIAGLGYRRGWPDVASVLAASVFMLGGSASARLNHTGIILCYGLFPLALLTLEIALERRSRRYALAFAGVTAMIVLARNQVALMLCFLLATFLAREALVSERPAAWIRSRLPVLALAGLVVALITIVPMLLTLQLAALSNRPAAALADALEASLHPINLVSVMAPDVFGSHVPGFNYWGPQHSLTPEVGATDDSFNYLFIGIVPSIVLLWLGVACGGLAMRGARTLAVIALLAVAFSLGRFTPLYPLVFAYVPGFTYFRRPVDGTFVLLIAIALLCGQLLAAFIRCGMPRPRPLPLALAVSGCVALVVGTVCLSTRTGHGIQAAQACATAALGGLAIAITLKLLGTPTRRSLGAMTLTAVAAAELVTWNAASRLNSEHRRHYEVLEAGANSAGLEGWRVLQAELTRRHQQGARPRVEIIGLDGPWQNLAMVQKVEATNGYNPLRIGIYDRFVAPGESSWVAKARRFPATFSDYDCALARALGLEYLVLGRPIEEVRGTSRRWRPEIIRNGPDVWIYRIPGAMPRVSFSSRIEVADVDETTVSGELSHPPAPDRVVIDTETPPPSGIVWMRAAGVGSTARIASWRPGKVEIEVRAAQAGVLVLHDIFYPGWVAEIDGTRVPVLRAEVLFRAVEVPAGSHTVVFRFEPLSLANLADAARRALGLHSAPRRPED